MGNVLTSMRSLLQDLRYGFRMLAKRPGFTAVALLALALGIGANTAVFSVIRGVLLRPLPYADPDRLVMLWESNLKSNDPREEVSAPNFIDWRAQSRSFSDMAGMSLGGYALTESGEPKILIGAAVTTNYFPMLGVPRAMGRGFTSPGTETPRRHRPAAHSRPHRPRSVHTAAIAPSCAALDCCVWLPPVRSPAQPPS